MRFSDNADARKARDRADARIRRLTRVVVGAATGATALIGVIVAREHPGASTPATSVTPPGSVHDDDDLDHPAPDIGIDRGVDRPHDNPDHVTTTAATDDHHRPPRSDLRGHVAMIRPVMDEPTVSTAQRSFRAIGTRATVVVRESWKVSRAEGILRSELAAIDLACSRFRADSELESVHSLSGQATMVSPLLFEALSTAVDVAESTGGAVDPTVGNAMARLGYDRDFDLIQNRRPVPLEAARAVPGFRHIHLHGPSRTVRIPRGVRLDLGSTAKALAADRAASRIADELGTGTLVSLGGDLAVAGPPPSGGWPVGIALASSMVGADVEQVVAIGHGGLASSSPKARSWVVGHERVHHILDPATGLSAVPHWKLVSAAGGTCVEANAATTAAVVWGQTAVTRLQRFNLAIRLVRHDGAVLTLGGWPEAVRT